MLDSLITHLIVFWLGAAIGSFLNVVIFRLPSGHSILHPPSRCPRCQHQLRPWENLPIVGWLGLRGRCAHCQQVISIRYPLIEALTGLLFLLSFWGFGFSITTLCYWVFLSWLVVLTFIDLDTFTLPNGLTQSGLVLGLTFQGLLGWSTAGTPDAIAHSLMEGLSGAVLGLWLFDIITWLGSGVMGQAAMGGGDAKLAAMLGAWFGWQGLLLASFLACGLGAFLGMSAIALGWMSRRQPMPFGPYLALGAVVTVFYGDSLIHSYLNLVGWTSYSPIP